jgi:predicted dehydrogenase
MDGVALAAFADIRPERARNFAEQYGGSAYPSFEALLDGEQIDAVHICTPHNCHVPMTALAAERGVAVFCEKPPLIRPDEWAALLQAEQKVPVGICFQNRYNPEIIKLREKIRSAGAVRGARAFVTWSRGAGYYAESGGWRGQKDEAGGGVMMNQAVHTLDLLIWLLGRPEGLEASLRNVTRAAEVEDEAAIWLRYPGGVRAVLYATTAYVSDAPVILEVQCENGAFRVEGDRTDAPKGYWGSGHPACIRDFYDCVRQSRPFALSPSRLKDTIDVLMEVYHGR